MLKKLELSNVGPSPSMSLELAPRLNLLTGDNGLGKSFLLDIAWWALTRKWPAEVNASLTAGKKALPTTSGDALNPFLMEIEMRGSIWITFQNQIRKSI